MKCYARKKPCVVLYLDHGCIHCGQRGPVTGPEPGEQAKPKPADLANLTAFEARGIRELLGEVDLLLTIAGYARVVGNGDVCPACRARGRGSFEPHEEDCVGVRALRDIRELLGKEPES